jgi:hypothetical protein
LLFGYGKVGKLTIAAFAVILSIPSAIRPWVPGRDVVKMSVHAGTGIVRKSSVQSCPCDGTDAAINTAAAMRIGFLDPRALDLVAVCIPVLNICATHAIVK